MPHFCRWNLLWRFNAYFWVPFPRRQNNHFIQKLINTCNQVFTVPGFIGNITEQLTGNKGIKSKYQINVFIVSVVCRGGMVPVTYIIHHKCSDSSANLIVGLGLAMRTQQDKEKPVRIVTRLISARTQSLEIEIKRET